MRQKSMRVERRRPGSSRPAPSRLLPIHARRFNVWPVGEPRAVVPVDLSSRFAPAGAGHERGPQLRLATNPSNDPRRDDHGAPPSSSRRPTHEGTTPMSISPQIHRLDPGLDPQQLEVVGHQEGPLLVRAGPGAGKTRVLIWRLINLLLRDVCAPEEMVLLAFGHLAAAEMRQRFEATARAVGLPRGRGPGPDSHHSLPEPPGPAGTPPPGRAPVQPRRAHPRSAAGVHERALRRDIRSSPARSRHLRLEEPEPGPHQRGPVL